MGYVLGFDHGEKRTGVAVAAIETGVATGLPTIFFTGRRELRKKVQALIDEYGPERMVVGLPLNLDGSAGERCRAAEAFADRLRSWFGVPVQLQDERLTTAQAERIREASGTSQRKAREGGLADRAAAVLILQAWLDARGLAPAEGTG